MSYGQANRGAKKGRRARKLLRDARHAQPEIDWVSVRDHYRGVEALEEISYCMRDYRKGE